MKYNMDNPVKPIKEQSLEKEQFKEQSKINKLLHLNLHILSKKKKDAERFNIIVLNGKMYY